MVDGVLVYEMLHTSLMAEGRDPKDASADWSAEAARLSPAVHGEVLKVARPQRRSVRIPNLSYCPDDRRKAVVRKVSGDDEGIHAAIARWPVPFRPPATTRRADNAAQLVLMESRRESDPRPR
jgi:hypothetical protein